MPIFEKTDPICLKGELLIPKTATTDQILRIPEEKRAKLRKELGHLFHDAFPFMPRETKAIYLEDYFRSPGKRFFRIAFMLINGGQKLIAAALCDHGVIKHRGRFITGIYLISLAVLSKYRNLGVGQYVISKIITELKSELFLATASQSSSLHLFLGLGEKGLIEGYEAFPRLENETLLTVSHGDKDLFINGFGQIYTGVAFGSRSRVGKAIDSLTPSMVRKNIYKDMYDFNPWGGEAREDSLAKALEVTHEDGVLVMIRKKRHIRAGE